MSDGGFDEAGDVLLDRDVGAHEHDPAGMGFGQGTAGSLGKVADDDAGAGADEVFGDGAADAAGSAGDDGGFVFESLHAGRVQNARGRVKR